MYVEAKLQFRTILDQVFPEYRKVFGDFFSKVSLLILKEYPTSEKVLESNEDNLSNSIQVLSEVVLPYGQEKRQEN